MVGSLALVRRLFVQLAPPYNGLVEWTHNGGYRGRHSSTLSAPLRPIRGQR